MSRSRRYPATRLASRPEGVCHIHTLARSDGPMALRARPKDVLVPLTAMSGNASRVPVRRIAALECSDLRPHRVDWFPRPLPRSGVSAGLPDGFRTAGQSRLAWLTACSDWLDRTLCPAVPWRQGYPAVATASFPPHCSGAACSPVVPLPRLGCGVSSLLPSPLLAARAPRLASVTAAWRPRRPLSALRPRPSSEGASTSSRGRKGRGRSETPCPP